mgnify:CR=1 FL=1
MVFSFLITIQEAKSLIDSYYEERLDHMSDDERIEEADKVSSRIAESLSERALSISLFIVNFFKVFTNTPEISEIIT